MPRLFTDEQEKFIKENVKGVLTADLTDLVNETFGTSYTVSQVRNLKNRRRWSSGLTTHFKKGHKPFNKGLKQTDYMTAEQIDKKLRRQGLRRIACHPIGKKLDLQDYLKMVI